MTDRTENKDTEPSEGHLEQREPRFNAMADASPDAIININSEGVIFFWNSAAEKMFGYSRREIIGQNVTTLMPERYRFEHRRGMNKFIAEGTGPFINHTNVTSALRKDNREFPIELTLSVWSQEGGTFVTGIVRDLSSVQTALRETEEHFNSMINSSLDGILAYDKNFTITLWNPEMERISGLASKDVLGKSSFELFPFLKKGKEGRAVQRGGKGQAIRQVEMYFEVPETDRKGYLESTHFPIYDIQGDVTGGMGIVREITERKKTEVNLRFSEEKFAKVFRASPDAITISTLEDGKTTDVNETFSRMSGFSRAEALGKSTVELGLIDSEDRDNFVRTLRAESRVQDMEVSARTKSGDFRYVLLAAETIQIEGRPHLITIVRDITGRKHLEEVLSNLATSFASSYGNEFFNRVCAHVCEAMDAEYAFIGRLMPGQRRVRVIGGVGAGKVLESQEYDLQGTPCDEIIDKEACVYQSKVQELFPDDQLLGDMKADGYAGIPLFALSGESLGIFVTLSKSPIKDEQLALSMMAGYSARVAAEIERTETEAALRSSEERFLKTFQHDPDAIAITSLENMKLVDVNEGFTQVTGFTKEEALGRSTDELGVSASSAEGQAVLEGIQTKRTIHDLDATLKNKAGEQREVVMSAAAIDLAGRPHMISIARDITERKKTQETIRQKDRDIRKAYVDVFSAVTDEKLLILTQEEIPAALGEPHGEPFTVSSLEQLADSRNFLRETLQTLGISQDLLNSLILASGEAVVNGVKHAGACEVQVFSLDGTIQIKTSDCGPGIDFSDLPKATLLPGFSTRKSLGMGFAVILDICDRVLLSTGPEGTTLILEVGGTKE